MRVAAGDLSILLNDTVTRANLAIITKQIDQFSARRMRLIANGMIHPKWSCPQRSKIAGLKSRSLRIRPVKPRCFKRESARSVVRKASFNSGLARSVKKPKVWLSVKKPRKKNCPGSPKSSSWNAYKPMCRLMLEVCKDLRQKLSNASDKETKKFHNEGELRCRSGCPQHERLWWV